jgi:glucose-6-phosphate 1-dehydrogenase
VDDAVFDRLARRMSYLSGDVSDAALYRSLATEIGDRQRPVYYLEVPPSLFAPIVEQLGAAKLLREGRVAVEKPFGHDLASARELNARLHRLLRESQILRVDHFLGKEPAVELEYLRFANVALADLWDRKSVSCVQITMAEDFGVEGRGRFYDSVGALRDVVQNHLLQVLALAAMDPPAGASAGDTQDKKAEDSVEETWRIVQPLLDHPPDACPYPRGSWGPEEAETLLRGHPRWQQPWLPEEG